MSNDSELLIKINADAKNAKKAFDDVKKQTEDLQDVLNAAGTAGAVAFGVATAAVILSVREFEKGQAAIRGVTNALQNQGIYTTELRNKYDQYAESLAVSTGVSKEAVLEAQATAQSFLGQTEITEGLTVAIGNLAATKKIDLNSAAQLVARSIGTSSNAFVKEGLVLSDTDTKAQRYAKTLEFLNARYKDNAASANQGFTGALNSLNKNFGDLTQKIGEKFQPVLTAATTVAANFFGVLSKSDIFSTFAVSVIAGVGAVGAFLAILPAVVAAFTTLKAVVAAFGVTSNIALAGIPIAIGLIVAAVTFLALNWDATMKLITASIQAAFVTISEIGGAIATVFKGIFTRNLETINEGMAQAKGAFAKGAAEFREIQNQGRAAELQDEEKQDAAKAALAAKREMLEKEKAARLVQIVKEKNELANLIEAEASQVLIDLQKEELALLQSINEEKTQAELSAIQDRLEKVRLLQEEAKVQELERSITFQEEMQALELELAQSGFEQTANINAQQQAQLQAQLLTEKEAEQKVLNDMLKARIDARNKELMDRKKYGQTVATLTKVLGSDEVQGTKQAADELVQLTQSKNNTLKSIGKAAALTQIAIATTESAMNIYKGFSTIPIIGPALGVAGAAAAIAFGAERAGKVVAAADGGLMTGGIPGKDSIPTLTMPNELIVPSKNFEEVVGAVRNDRAGGGGGDSGMIVAAINTLGELIRNMRTFVFQGDVLADEAYIDALLKKLADGVDYRNARLPATELR